MKTLILILCTLIIAPAFAQRLPVQKKSYITNKLQGKIPEIDADFSDEAWKLVEWEENFIQREPLNGKSPSQRTAFKITYDDNNIYVALKAFDSIPSQIITRMSRRDEREGDLLGIQFDSYNDKLTAFTFWVSAAGVKADAMFSNDGDNEDYSWDPIWYVKTALVSDGWQAEMRIPLSQLRFNKNDQQIWGMEVMRYIQRKEELSLWQHIPKDASGWVHHFGELQGIIGIKPQRQIELLPYLVAKADRYEAEEGNPFKTGKLNKLTYGLDGKIGITNDFTLDFTVNPDFGQVEADPSEVNLSGFE